jgi:hypothetical protein
MKKPTWKQLRQVADDDRAEEFLRDTPVEWRPAIALALSCAKWSPERGQKQGRGSLQCGLCALYDSSSAISDDCKDCPLYLRTARGCGESGTIWDNWCGARTPETKTKYAYRLYNLLMQLYKEEYER